MTYEIRRFHSSQDDCSAAALRCIVNCQIGAIVRQDGGGGIDELVGEGVLRQVAQRPACSCQVYFHWPRWLTSIFLPSVTTSRPSANTV